MKLGTINDPRKNLLEEIRWIGENGFDFIDLSIEPPKAYFDHIDVSSLSSAIERYNLDVIGHTYCLIPIGSPLKSLREASLRELSKCLPIFSDLGASKMNVHLDGGFSLSREDDTISYNIEVLEKLSDRAKKCGLQIIVEHFRGPFSKVKGLKKVLDALPEVGFHLDVGHANLFGSGNKTKQFLEKFHHRLSHVHFSDNKGGNDDMHLPIGAGNIDWKEVIKTLKKYGYDGTVTLEIFSEYREYLLTSKKIVEKLWEEV
jgi:sugar phosphate isomerase/epimerase